MLNYICENEASWFRLWTCRRLSSLASQKLWKPRTLCSAMPCYDLCSASLCYAELCLGRLCYDMLGLAKRCLAKLSYVRHLRIQISLSTHSCAALCYALGPKIGCHASAPCNRPEFGPTVNLRIKCTFLVSSHLPLCCEGSFYT